jgi:hypothetical protein
MSYDYQLEHALRKHPGFLGVFASDELPDRVPPGSSLIVNYGASNTGGSHWVAMRNLNGRGDAEYFDSYGFPADAEDILLKSKTHFEAYLKSYSATGRYVYNKLNLQCVDSDVRGQYCVYFIKHGLPFLSNGRSKEVVNPRWKLFVRARTCERADATIRKAVGV